MRARARFAVGPVALLAITVSLTGRATEAGSRFSLSWTRLPGAERCLSPTLLARRIEDRLGRPVFVAPGQSDVSVEGYVGRTETGFHASVSITDEHGTVIGKRELQSVDATCQDLDAPLALTMSLLIDPNAALAPPTVGAEEEEPRERAHDAPRHPAVADRSRSDTFDGWRASTELGGAVAVGLLPSPAPGLVLRGSVTPPRALRVVADGALFAEQETTPNGNGNPVGFALVEGGLGVCPFGMDLRPFELRLCAGATVGVVSTRGLYDESIRVRHRVATGALVRAEVDWALGRHVFLELAVGGRLPFIRDSFEYQHNDERQRLFLMSPVAAVFDLGLGFQSP